MYPHTDGYASENLHAFDAKFIARALGGDVVSRNQIAAPGPGHSRKDRSLSVRVTPTGFMVHSHAGDDWRECRDYVKGRLGVDTRQPVKVITPPDVAFVFNKPDPDKIALRLWDQGVAIGGTLAQAYLESRGIVEDPDTESLRWHAPTRAMLALFRNIITDEPQAVSRTFINPNGTKRERKFLGPVKGAAIKLDADEEVTNGLHIGEGIETCLSARLLGLRPTWALGSASAIAAFPVLDGVECLSLLREHDEANKRGADACGTRWHAAGREVVDIRPIAGKDLNDSVRGAA
jgi:putative DNA primase/helicase